MILYFSGTGNSADVAKRLADLTGDRTVKLTPDLSELTLDSDEKRVIWVFPVQSWGVPPYVRERIATLKFHGQQLTHHMVATCGDDAGMTDRMWRKEMADAGHRTGGCFTVIMPNTYVALPGFDVDREKIAAGKLEASVAAVNRIASLLPEIERSGIAYTSMTRGVFPRIKTGVIYPWFMRHAINPGKFIVSDSCVKCGRCERICPVGNISRPDGSPEWRDVCTGCLACYHACPSHAIEYGSFTRHKGQYLNPEVKL